MILGWQNSPVKWVYIKSWSVEKLLRGRSRCLHLVDNMTTCLGCKNNQVKQLF